MIYFLLKAERVLGVHRNFEFLSFCNKFFIIFRVIFELIAISYVFYHNCYTFLIPVTGSTKKITPVIFLIFYFCNFLGGFVIMIYGIRKSRSFKLFFTSIMSLHYRFKTESLFYKDNSKRFKYVVKIVVMFHSCGCAIMFMTKALNKIYREPETMTFLYFVFVFLEIYIEMRHIMENVVLYTYVTMIYYFMKTVNHSISSVVEEYDRKEKKSYEERKEENEQILTIHDLDEWAIKYRDLVGCCKKLSACFSSQMLFCLFISSVQLVTSVYGIFCIIVIGVTKHIVFSMVGVYVLIYAIFSAYFVIFAGQHLLNENAIIKKSVATLYSTWSTRPQAPETKRLRNLNKLVNVNPIQIEYTNKIVLGMYLVPIIMSLSASYVIVGLQFNHVI
ncbi:unnamed protein product [Spodoptera littoralis]|uniref:Gustatory receptor n=1 Tax=Spodoptera littoralis TaxID=7109 RepID=A0A9P0IHH3_SPOLI|nr:unnamed protein product [Spodoptera littoralis]CAH1645886.1 unnamed protein product [Spodoptera littoralis]